MIRLAAVPGTAAPAKVQALWTDLLARLALAAVASTQAQARLQLRALGVRRNGSVTNNLARESSTAQRMAAAAGVAVQPLDLHRRVGELAQPRELVCHLRGLALTYRQLALHPVAPPHGPLAKWLAVRQRVHAVQIEAIEQLPQRLH